MGELTEAEPGENPGLEAGPMMDEALLVFLATSMTYAGVAAEFGRKGAGFDGRVELGKVLSGLVVFLGAIREFDLPSWS